MEKSLNPIELKDKTNELPEEDQSLPLDRIEDQSRKNYFARMPDEAALNKCFDRAFLINKPMGSVGGDGLWMYREGGKIFLAIFNCMGQGHLASMMTRIYANALRKLIAEYKIEFTGSILQFIHREIQTRFKDKENIQLNTGAHLGIIKLDIEERAMEFAGARMDLVRELHGEVERVAGDDYQIGELTDEKQEYASNAVELKPGSTYYIATDGTTRIIGGPNYKRFGKPQFDEMVAGFTDTEFLDRKEVIVKRLDEWRGANTQNDDILVVAFQL
ncbi:MAG: SpoIIE family protein phosphatase [Bacteroidota bacterium]